MRRREFITLLGGVATTWPLAARAQQPIDASIGHVNAGLLRWHSGTILEPFYRGLRDLGYIEGKNIVIERRYADGDVKRLSDQAAELIKLKPDIIVAWSTALAAKHGTNTIPIVAAVMADPVGDELVASLARPASNITGTTFLGPELVAKRLQLLKEVIPKLSRVAALWHPHAYSERTMASMSKETEAAARTLGMQLQLVPATSPDDLASAFSTIAKDHPDAFIVFPSPMLFGSTNASSLLLRTTGSRRSIKRGNSLMPEA